MSLGNGEGLPFAPIVEALRRLPAIIETGGAGSIRDIGELRTSETSDLGRLLPELGPTTSPEQGVFDRPGWVQARIFEGLLALLRCLGDAIPVGAHRRGSSLGRRFDARRAVVPGTQRADGATRGRRHVPHR